MPPLGNRVGGKNSDPRRDFVVLGISAVCGALFGLAVSAIPAPDEPTVFWVGNFSSPWAVLPFLAGWSQRSVVWAAFTGAVADVASVVGFYAKFLMFDPAAFDLPRSTDITTIVVTSAGHWLEFIGPWVFLAVAAGLLYGTLGAWWGRSRRLVAGVAVAMPFIAEPLLWPIYNGFYKGPLVVWVAEVAVGLLLLAWIVSAWRHGRSEHSPSSAGT
jgi:hypothetical protein